MDAPGITPPDASLTTPVIDAVVTPWAYAPADSATTQQAARASARANLNWLIANSSSCGSVSAKGNAQLYRGGVTHWIQKRPPERPAAFDPISRSRRRLADAGDLLLAQLLRLVAQPIGFLEQLLLLGGILLQVRLEPQQEILVHERFGIVRLDLQRVIDGLDALADVFAFLVFLQLVVAIRFVPVVGRDRIERFGVVRLFLRALLERLDRLVEASLAVVVAGERHVDGGIARFGFLRHLEHLLGLFVRAGVFVDLRERSEEHTSELQSPMYLVCRLLLEKKKKKTKQNNL